MKNTKVKKNDALRKQKAAAKQQFMQKKFEYSGIPIDKYPDEMRKTWENISNLEEVIQRKLAEIKERNLKRDELENRLAHAELALGIRELTMPRLLSINQAHLEYELEVEEIHLEGKKNALDAKNKKNDSIKRDFENLYKTLGKNLKRPPRIKEMLKVISQTVDGKIGSKLKYPPPKTSEIWSESTVNDWVKQIKKDGKIK